MRSRGKRKKGNTAKLAARLAPAEELARGSVGVESQTSAPSGGPHPDPHYGAIVVDNDSLHIPKDIMESGNEKTYLGMEPVVLVILGGMLVFIAFIAWQISLMPPE